MTYLSVSEIEILRSLVALAERTESAKNTDKKGLDSPSFQLTRLAGKLERMLTDVPDVPDAWICEQHGTLVAIRGYQEPDKSVYKSWIKAKFVPS